MDNVETLQVKPGDLVVYYYDVGELPPKKIHEECEKLSNKLIKKFPDNKTLVIFNSG